MAAKKRSTAKASKPAPASRGAAAALATKKAKVARPAISDVKAASPKPVVKQPAVKKIAMPAADAPALAEGAQAPSFELSDQAGATLSSASLAGRPYVLYFYPRNDTPGCTTEACGFRDSHTDFDKAGVRVLGVSPDSVASHQKFVGKYGLPFTLLSDPDRSLASAYGVWALKKLYGRESMGIVRSTFLVDGEGVIRKVWRGVRVNGHIAEVQSAALALA